MKQLLLIVAMITGLSFSTQAQTENQSNLRFDLNKIKVFDTDTQKWQSEFTDLTQTAYIQYVRGTHFHIHLPEYDIDFNAKIMTSKEYDDKDGDKVYEYKVYNEEDVDYEFTVKFIFYKDGTGKQEIYLLDSEASLLFRIYKTQDLSVKTNTYSN